MSAPPEDPTASTTPRVGGGAAGDGPPPSRGFGRDFRFVWASFGASNLADGILLAAGPLLVASVTRDPVLVSGAVVVQRLPLLLFGLLAGAVVDRVDRRRLMVLVNALRAVVLVGLTGLEASGSLDIASLYALLFALGLAETFVDTAGSTLVAATVDDTALGRANARLTATASVTNRLAGPALGAALFGLGSALPFGVDAALLALASVLVARVAVDGRGVRDPAAPPEPLSEQLLGGLRFLRRTPPVRRLTIVILLFNLTYGATYGVMVLYALERLGLGDAGFGLLLTAGSVGGLVGASLFGRLEQRFSYTSMLRVGLLLETSTHLVLASTSSWVVAASVFVLFGVHEAVWGSLANTIKLRAVPEHVLGRVNSIYLLAVYGPLAIGAALGGWLAGAFGITAPFWYAGVGAALTTVWAWRGLADLGRYSTVE